MNGVFLSLDGVDGAGKSTQLGLLEEWLLTQGHSVVRCREPGGTEVGERIRDLLLHTECAIGAAGETLLYMASRAELVARVIRPAIADGQVVLCDRFLLSTVAYQGHAGGIDPEQVRAVGRFATGGLQPDWTGVLDIDPQSAAARRLEPADRIEGRSPDFHRRVREGFLIEARQDPERISVIPAGADPRMVHRHIVREVRHVLDAAARS